VWLVLLLRIWQEALLKEGYQTALLEEKIQVGLCDGLAAEWKWIQTVYKNY